MTDFSPEYQQSLRQSTINRITRCAHQHLMLLTHGIRPPGIAAISGSAVHTAAEYNHKQKIKSGKDELVSVLKDCAEQAFIDRLYDEGVFMLEEDLPFKRRIIEDARNRTFVCTETYHRDSAPKIHPVEEYTEKEFVIDVGLDLPLGIKMDTADKDHHLWDFKTSVSKYQKTYIKKAIQPTHYALGYHKLTGQYPTFHAEVLIENGEYQPLEHKKTDTDFERHLRICKTVINVIKSGLYPPCCPDPKLSWWCSEKWCGWYRLCEFT